jgi:ankyrin repeat protein
VAAGIGRGRGAPADGGALTPLVYAVRSNDLETVKVLLTAGADVNQVTGYGWSPLLVAAQNRYYKLGAYLLDRGANPNLANKGGGLRSTWRPITATSRAATTRCARATWIIWRSSRSSSTREPMSTPG